MTYFEMCRNREELSAAFDALAEDVERTEAVLADLCCGEVPDWRRCQGTAMEAVKAAAYRSGSMALRRAGCPEHNVSGIELNMFNRCQKRDGTKWDYWLDSGTAEDAVLLNLREVYTDGIEDAIARMLLRFPQTLAAHPPTPLEVRCPCCGAEGDVWCPPHCEVWGTIGVTAPECTRRYTATLAARGYTRAFVDRMQRDPLGFSCAFVASWERKWRSSGPERWGNWRDRVTMGWIPSHFLPDNDAQYWAWKMLNNHGIL